VLESTRTDLSNAEYPFVNQNSKVADQYASARALQSIHLPSGDKWN
jgi:hypothetical protein